MLPGGIEVVVTGHTALRPLPPWTRQTSRAGLGGGAEEEAFDSVLDPCGKPPRTPVDGRFDERPGRLKMASQPECA
jgi:hypothetical protein